MLKSEKFWPSLAVIIGKHLVQTKTQSPRGIFRDACARLWALQRTIKVSFRSDHRIQLAHGTHAADLMLARALGHK
jgi:hypothetical protein